MPLPAATYADRQAGDSPPTEGRPPGHSTQAARGRPGSLQRTYRGQPDGTAVAADIDTRALDATRAPNLSVRRMDVTREDFDDASFDLILIRAVLSLVPEPEQVLSRAARCLAPGGWLVVEDFSFMPAEDSPTAAGRGVIGGCLEAFAANGADMRVVGRRLPAYVARAG